MDKLSLNGRWQYERKGGGESGIATVPGDIYMDLLNNKQIPDPFYRDNEEYLQWIGDSEWSFQRTFTMSASLLKRDRVLLRCDGLDTLAKVRINGKLVAKTDNMFRIWEWDVKPLLQAGENSIQVDFASAVTYCDKAYAAHTKSEVPFHNKNYQTMATWIRKEQCNFGWDWGIKAATCGIWQDIGIVAFDTARLSEVKMVQEHQESGVRGQVSGGRAKDPNAVVLKVGVAAEKVGRPALMARVSVRLKGKLVATKEQAFRGKCASVAITISDPKLWWPNNMGDQPLYGVTVELLDKDAKVLDATTKRIGLRTLRLDRHPDEWGESFQFVVNGVPFFAKGANWIPADGIQARMTPVRYRELIEDTAAANMNMLRIWGGGIYEDVSFYEACDELGICIWQDFMFGHGSHYPVDNAEFRSNVAAEARDQVKRLRHHACLALWCGNNEQEQGAVQPKARSHDQMAWKDYSKVFDKLLAEIVGDLHPDCDYWPSSPHTPHGDRQEWNDPTCGDAHLWEVWHGGKPFEWYRTCEHRFNSEFGFQSLPEPKTVYDYTEEHDRNVTSYVMEQHQRSHGNGRIMEYMLQWFQAPNGFENTLWLTQILQGMSIKYACEHWRRMMPRGMGTLYWQLNDCWPVASWSSIDYHGRWKALHYMAKNFFAPLMVSGVEDVEKGTVEIHVTSDLMKVADASVSWVVTDVDGKRLSKGGRTVRAAARSTRKVETLRLGELVEAHEKRGLLVWLELKAPGQSASRNLVFFARPIRRQRIFAPRPKHLDLNRKPGMAQKIARRADGTFDVTLSTKRPALWVWLELDKVDARMSDNFFHLRPGASLKVNVAPERELSVTELRKCLAVRSLVDTYR